MVAKSIHKSPKLIRLVEDWVMSKVFIFMYIRLRQFCWALYGHFGAFMGKNVVFRVKLGCARNKWLKRSVVFSRSDVSFEFSYCICCR
jgi:hypothetical protein